MNEGMYPPATPGLAARRTQLAPHISETFESFSRAVFAEGALPEKVKQLIAVAVAHVTQCPYCIAGHTKLAHRKGAGPDEIMEAIWVAAEMRAGGAFAHSTLALHALGGRGSRRSWVMTPAPEQSAVTSSRLPGQPPDVDPAETQEWRESLDGVVDHAGPHRARQLMLSVLQRARERHVGVAGLRSTDYINTIAAGRAGVPR